MFFLQSNEVFVYVASFFFFECEVLFVSVCLSLPPSLLLSHKKIHFLVYLWQIRVVSHSGRVVVLPGNRLGTSLMAGRPVPRLEERGVVEWTEGDAMGLR